MAGTERKAGTVFLIQRPEIFDELQGKWQEQARVVLGLVDLYDRYGTLLKTYGDVSLPEVSFLTEEGEFKVSVTGLTAGDGISIAINFKGKDGMANTSTCRLKKGKHQVMGRVGNEPMGYKDIRRYAELAGEINSVLIKHYLNNYEGVSLIHAGS